MQASLDLYSLTQILIAVFLAEVWDIFFLLGGKTISYYTNTDLLEYGDMFFASHSTVSQSSA